MAQEIKELKCMKRDSFEICKKLQRLEEMGYDVERILADALNDSVVEDREYYLKVKPEKIQEEGGHHGKEMANLEGKR